LDPAKRDRILNAAMHEFARSGFDRASTNEIVKEAEISKGLLFHYFANKKGLYLFVYDHCIEVSLKRFYDELDLSETDFFARLQQAAQLKLRIQRQYPSMFRFFEAAYAESSPEVRPELETRLKELSDSGFATIFAGVDLTKFKEGTDISKTIKLILWTFEGFVKEEIDKARKQGVPLDYDCIMAEADGYIRLFKQVFYR